MGLCYFLKFPLSNNLLLFVFIKVSVCNGLEQKIYVRNIDTYINFRGSAAPGVGQVLLFSMYVHSHDIIKIHFLKFHPNANDF